MLIYTCVDRLVLWKPPFIEQQGIYTGYLQADVDIYMCRPACAMTPPFIEQLGIYTGCLQADVDIYMCRPACAMDTSFHRAARNLYRLFAG